MKVREFVEHMNKNVNATMKDKQVLDLVRKTLEVKKYISIKEKKKIIDEVINQCIYYDNGTFRIDNINSYVIFTMSVIDTYTNLEVYDIEECYDILSEANLLTIIIGSFELEYNEINILFNMKRDEILENNSVEMQIGRFLNEILDKVDGFGDYLIKSMDELDINKDAILNFVNTMLK